MARQQRHQRDQGNERQVLEQQHGEAVAPGAALQQLALRQQGQHDGGGGHRQPRAHHHCARPADAGRVRHRRESRAAQHKLRGAQPEHRPAHHPQPLRPQFQPDQEQQHDHAEAGDVGDLAHAGDQSQAGGADRHARHQIAEHAAEPGAARQRHRDRDGGEQGNQRCQHRRRSAWVDQEVAYSAHGDHSEGGVPQCAWLWSDCLAGLAVPPMDVEKIGAARMSAPPPRGSRNPLGARHRGGNRTPVNHRLRASNMV